MWNLINTLFHSCAKALHRFVLRCFISFFSKFFNYYEVRTLRWKIWGKAAVRICWYSFESTFFTTLLKHLFPSPLIALHTITVSKFQCFMNFFRIIRYPYWTLYIFSRFWHHVKLTLINVYDPFPILYIPVSSQCKSLSSINLTKRCFLDHYMPKKITVRQTYILANCILLSAPVK